MSPANRLRVFGLATLLSLGSGFLYPVSAADPNEVFFGFHSSLSKEKAASLRGFFEPVLRIMGQKLGKKVTTKVFFDQAEWLKAFKRGEFHFGYATDWNAYVRAKREIGARGFLSLEMFGKDRFATCVFVPEKSPVKNMAQLKGKTIMLRPILEDVTILKDLIKTSPKQYFKQIVSVVNPDTLLKSMSEGIADAGMGPEVARAMVRLGTGKDLKIRIIGCGPALPMGPVLAGPRSNPKDITIIQNLLTNMAKDPSFKNVKPIFDRVKGKFFPFKESDFAPAFRLADKAKTNNWQAELTK